MSWIMPFPESTITGEYGTMSAYRRKHGLQAHSGTDWAPKGSNKGKTPMPAIADGKVSLIHYSKFLGWVVVQSAVDKAGKTWYIGYCHLKCKTHGINCKKSHAPEQALDVRLGDVFKAGDTSHGMILGTTGVSSSGVHMHATLSKTVKGVFGMTKDKFDLKKAIKANSGPGPEKDVKVELIPRNGNVVVKVTNFPAGYKLRLRKDGQSVWNKTGKSTSEVHQKGVSLSGKHVLSLEINDAVFWKETVSKGAVPKPAPKAVAPKKAEAPAPVVPAKSAEPTRAPSANVGPLSQDEWKAFQEILKRDHGYTGVVDGIPGGLTYRSLQRSVVAHGYNGPIDGDPGANTYRALQRRLVSKGLYEGRIDGTLGNATYAAWREAIHKNVY